ncbi:MAG: hypothetical protein FIA95_11015 [Gemmatimonadetes bacterium]|nr:hypothetical protein [Gemmatimonadota bacterium]
MLLGTAGLVACALGPGPARAQDVLPPNRGGFTVSMGLPPRWRWAAGVSLGVHNEDAAKVTAYANVGVYRDLLNPMTSMLGVLGEAYGGTRGAFAESEGVDGGVRLGLYSPITRLAFGGDYNAQDHELDLILSLIHPFQRGGLLKPGGSFRVDWLPGRGNSVGLGVRLPIAQPFLGKTRPRQDHVPLPDPEPPPIFLIPDPSLVDALANAATHARWVNRLTVPFTDQWSWGAEGALERFAEDLDVLRRHLTPSPGDPATVRSPTQDADAYHAELDRAFSIATSGRGLAAGESTSFGRATAQKAREIILERVLLPYDRLLGQKKNPDTTRGLGTAASAEFYEWLTRETSLEFAQLRATTWTFAQVLDLVEKERAYNLRQWKDSRFIWLPFQLALRPEDHDEQHELNALVERATRQTFTRGNERWYIENDQFQAELTRMIREAEDYHVLWGHDFRGWDAEGNPDEEGFKQVVNAYLRALIDRVGTYDAVGKIPQYLIFIDQMYFQANGGRLWLDLLQNPLHHKIHLPRGFEAWEDSIAALQTELRFAVASSALMQSQALQFGEGWIENVVKVHVNVTNPPDPYFWTEEIFPFFMGTPDVIMRDHRKISFYDVTEEDPYKGMAIYTGMGVGEHYVGASWEDRAMMVQGPVLLSLKDAARQLLLDQGMGERDIPWELRPKPKAADYDREVADTLAAEGDWGWDMQLHNQIGFRFKAVTVFKATLYTLMPPGSIIKAPDSIWGSHLWASMLLGHALRGGHALIIAPAIANAPSSGFPQMAQAQDVLARMVVASSIFDEELKRTGGLLKVGLYNSTLAVDDVPRKLQAFTSKLETTPWLRELYNFHPDAVAVIEEETAALIREGYEHQYPEGGALSPPKLHMKANYFATKEAWDQLLSRPEVGQSLRIYFHELAERNRALGRGEYRDFRAMADALLPPTREILRQYASRLTPEERSHIAFFFAIGSHNQNNRSMALDGEVALVVAGWSALFGLPDFLVIAGLSEWIDDLDELETLCPSYRRIKRRISRVIRIAV